MKFSARSQSIVVWWALAFTVIYAIALIFLFDMVPPPTPKLSAPEVADWYADRHTEIRLGAMVGGWVSAFMLPLAAVIAVQTARLERGGKIWSVLIIAGGAMMSIFLLLPTLFWGVAAFTPERAPEITATMHELGMLTLTTTDQYYIFMWVGIAVICFLPTTVKHSPFPRWFGFMTVWIAIMFEAGAIAFIPRSGAFAWNGLFVFWFPLTLFGIWIATMCTLLLRALKRQREDPDPEPASAAVAEAA